MALIRCPECGRAADGRECLACGYAWPQAAPEPAAPAPPPRPAAPAPVALEQAPRPPSPPPIERPPVTPAAAAAAEGFEQQLATAEVPRPSSLAGRAVEVVPAGSAFEAVLRSPLAFVLAGGLPFLFVVAVGSVLLLSSRDPMLHRIDSGGAGGVIEEVLKKPVASRTGRDYLLLGHAYARNGQTPQAVDAYHEAGKAAEGDARALDYAVAALDHPHADSALRALVEWQGERVGKALVKAARSERWYLRANALQALKERGEATVEVLERAAVLDIQLGKRCDERRQGLLRLRSMGVSDDAIEAIESLRERYVENVRCISTADIDGALLAVRKRQTAE